MKKRCKKFGRLKYYVYLCFNQLKIEIMKYTSFKIGNKVRVADCYRLDEVAQDINTSEVAIIRSEPSDDEELVSIQYESGEIDFVPQDILEEVFQSFKVTLTFDGVDGKNPLEVAKLIAKWCKEDADTFTYDVVNEDGSGEAWTVDLSEDDEDAVLPNNEVR